MERKILVYILAKDPDNYLPYRKAHQSFIVCFALACKYFQNIHAPRKRKVYALDQHVLKLIFFQ